MPIDTAKLGGLGYNTYWKAKQFTDADGRIVPQLDQADESEKKAWANAAEEIIVAYERNASNPRPEVEWPKKEDEKKGDKKEDKGEKGEHEHSAFKSSGGFNKPK